MRVHGVGSTTTGLLICGESPGYYESKSGTPFVGKTGDELNRYLDGETLPARSDWFLTNLYREYHSEEGYVYTAEDLAQDEPDLLAELRRVQPRLIVPLGRHASRYFLGDIDMGSVWGIPWVLPVGDTKLSFLQDTIVLPVHHPAAGMWNSEMSPYVVARFQAVAAYLRGETEPRALFDDVYPEVQYDEIRDERSLAKSLRILQTGQALSIDTEGWIGTPWSVQFSYEPGTAYLIRATRGELLRSFGQALHRIRPRLCYHSALHDLG